MVDNQHKKISGYRDLSEAEIAAMNEIKATEKGLMALIDKLATTPPTNPRWVSIARTDLEKGFMALIRAIARPNGE